MGYKPTQLAAGTYQQQYPIEFQILRLYEEIIDALAYKGKIFT